MWRRRDFPALVLKSGLCTETDLADALRGLDASRWSERDRVATRLVDRGLLTRWQADKLLEGKHRGFFLGDCKLLGPLWGGERTHEYLAHHTQLGVDCVVKVATRKLRSARDYPECVLREGRIGRSLEHPNVVKTLGFGPSKDLGTAAATADHIAYQHDGGVPLDEVIRSRGQFDVEAAIDLFTQASRGLQHLHDRGFLHLDVKPLNLLLTADGRVLLRDFLSACRRREDGTYEDPCDTSGEPWLTALYAPPEAALARDELSPASDVYSLDCVLYELLVGQPPFQAEPVAELLLQHQTEAPPDVRVRRPEVPLPIANAIHRMLSKRPEKRHGSVAEAADAVCGSRDGPTSPC